MKLSRVTISLSLAAVVAPLVGCDDAVSGKDGGTQTDSGTGAGDRLVVRGLSGRDVVIDRLWDRGCVGDGGSWQYAERTLTSLQLVSTFWNYENGSATPDCTNGLVATIHQTATIRNENMQLAIEGWVDAQGNPMAPPTGLESATIHNALSALITVATLTPATAARAASMNTAMDCGINDWVAGVARDVVACFTGGINPLKGSMLTDDRTMPWANYDGFSGDPSEYPKLLEGFAPHRGPFSQSKKP